MGWVTEGLELTGPHIYLLLVSVGNENL